MNVARPRPTIPRRQILQELNTGAATRAHSGDMQMRGKNLVQMLLFGPEVLALPRFV